MTVEGDDDPEIIVGAEPSAPPLAETASIPVASALHAPPVPVPVATPLGPPVPLAVAAQSSEASHGNSTIEKTANPDGGLSVEANNQHDDRRGRTEAAMDEVETQGTGAVHGEVAVLPLYKRKGFVYAMIAVTLVAVGVAVLAVVLPSNNKGRPDQFTTKSELQTAIWEYLEQGCPTDVNCQARSVYGGAVSLCDVLPWSVYHIWSSNIPFCDSDG